MKHTHESLKTLLQGACEYIELLKREIQRLKSLRGVIGPTETSRSKIQPPTSISEFSFRQDDEIRGRFLTEDRQITPR